MSLQIIRIGDTFGEIKLDDGTKLLISITQAETAIFTLNFFHFPSKKIWSIGNLDLVEKLKENIPTMIVTDIMTILDNENCENVDQVNQILCALINNKTE